MVQTQFNCPIKSLQTDWGGEYRNVSNYLQTQGIIHYISCPYTQEQNAAVERRNRIIIEKGTNLVNSIIPPTYILGTRIQNRHLSS